MSREDQYNVTVTIAGLPTGTWDKLTGGNVTSEETKYRPGGMSPQVSLGGSTSTENITVSRLYKLERDHDRAHWLAGICGKAEAVAVKQPLDVDGNPWGQPIVYSGILQEVHFPDHDSESNDAALLELVISTEGGIG